LKEGVHLLQRENPILLEELPYPEKARSLPLDSFSSASGFPTLLRKRGSVFGMFRSGKNPHAQILDSITFKIYDTPSDRRDSDIKTDNMFHREPPDHSYDAATYYDLR